MSKIERDDENALPNEADGLIRDDANDLVDMDANHLGADPEVQPSCDPALANIMKELDSLGGDEEEQEVDDLALLEDDSFNGHRDIVVYFPDEVAAEYGVHRIVVSKRDLLLALANRMPQFKTLFEEIAEDVFDGSHDDDYVFAVDHGLVGSTLEERAEKRVVRALTRERRLELRAQLEGEWAKTDRPPVIEWGDYTGSREALDSQLRELNSRRDSILAGWERYALERRDPSVDQEKLVRDRSGLAHLESQLRDDYDLWRLANDRLFLEAFPTPVKAKAA